MKAKVLGVAASVSWARHTVDVDAESIVTSTKPGPDEYIHSTGIELRISTVAPFGTVVE